MDDGTTLTARQRRFVDAYLVDLNATHAAKAAGFRCKNENSAAVQGCKTLRVPKVKAAIQARLRAECERMKLSVEYVEERLMTEAQGHGPDTNSSARIKAAELLGRRLGGFFPPEEHRIKASVSQSTVSFEVAQDPIVQQAALAFIKVTNPDLHKLLSTPSVLDDVREQPALPPPTDLSDLNVNPVSGMCLNAQA